MPTIENHDLEVKNQNNYFIIEGDICVIYYM